MISILIIGVYAPLYSSCVMTGEILKCSGHLGLLENTLGLKHAII